MSIDLEGSPSARDPSLAQRLRAVITALNFASDATLPHFRFSTRIRVVSALNGIRRFRTDRNRREPLAELDRIFHELAGQTPPAQTLPDRIEATGGVPKRPCVTQYFVAVPLRGTGDIVLTFRDRSLLERANALLDDAA
jgi:hypothetical protein